MRDSTQKIHRYQNNCIAPLSLSLFIHQVSHSKFSNSTNFNMAQLDATAHPSILRETRGPNTNTPTSVFRSRSSESEAFQVNKSKTSRDVRARYAEQRAGENPMSKHNPSGSKTHRLHHVESSSVHHVSFPLVRGSTLLTDAVFARVDRSLDALGRDRLAFAR